MSRMKSRLLFLANNVYGKHGGPYQPGTSLGLLFHLFSGGEDELQGFNGHVMGGMGAITGGVAGAARKRGAEIRISSPVGRILVRNGRVRGVALEDGTEVHAGLVVSNADPKHTFLGLLEARELPEDFREKICGIKMAGPCAKVNLVLGEEPQFIGTPAGSTPGERTNYTLVRSRNLRNGATTSRSLERYPRICGWIAWSRRTWMKLWRRGENTS